MSSEEQTEMKYINHNHPLVYAAMIIRRGEVDLSASARRPLLKRDREKVSRALWTVRHAQEYLAAQISANPECWEAK